MPRPVRRDSRRRLIVVASRLAAAEPLIPLKPQWKVDACRVVSTVSGLVSRMAVSHTAIGREVLQRCIFSNRPPSVLPLRIVIVGSAQRDFILAAASIVCRRNNQARFSSRAGLPYTRPGSPRFGCSTSSGSTRAARMDERLLSRRVIPGRPDEHLYWRRLNQSDPPILDTACPRSLPVSSCHAPKDPATSRGRAMRHPSRQSRSPLACQASSFTCHTPRPRESSSSDHLPYQHSRSPYSAHHGQRSSFANRRVACPDSCPTTSAPHSSTPRSSQRSSALHARRSSQVTRWRPRASRRRLRKLSPSGAAVPRRYWGRCPRL